MNHPGLSPWKKKSYISTGMSGYRPADANGVSYKIYRKSKNQRHEDRKLDKLTVTEEIRSEYPTFQYERIRYPQTSKNFFLKCFYK